MKLTYAGSLFYEWAISTLHSHTQLEWKLGDIVSGSRTLIRLGLSPHRSERLLAPVLERFYSMYENCDIQIIEQPTYILRQMLEEDKLDLILDISSPDTINYESELLVKESFVLAIPDSLCPFSDPSQKEEDISATPQIHLPALSAIPFILLSEDHDLGKISRKICETAAFHPNIRCICTSSNTAFSLARRGMGATFLPEIYARTTSFPNIHFFTPDHFHDTRDICAVYRKNIYHHAQFQALLALLREIVPAIYGSLVCPDPYLNSLIFCLLLYIFQCLIHRHMFNPSIFYHCHNCIGSDSDQEYFHIDLRIDPKCDPAGNTGQHISRNSTFITAFSIGRLRKQTDDHHDSCRPDIKPADLSIGISQDLRHGNSLCIFLNNDLG